jgi:hypothetical protein
MCVYSQYWVACIGDFVEDTGFLPWLTEEAGLVRRGDTRDDQGMAEATPGAGARPTIIATARARVERVALVAGMGLATLNIFTGSPLAALWLGAAVQGTSGQISMLGVLVIAVSMFTFSIALSRLLNLLSNRYDTISGRSRTVKRHTPWLRSMSGERIQYEHERAGLTPLEIILVIAVISLIGAYEYWFFFQAGSPFDQRTGRG